MPVTTRKMSRERDRDNGDLNNVASTHSVTGTTRKRQRPVHRTTNERKQIQNRSPPQAPREGDATPEISRPLPLLPDELILEILSWLPVKYLLQFRCVCKSWKSFISDPQFVKRHLHKSTWNSNFTHHHLLSIKGNNEIDVLSCSVETLFRNPSIPSTSVSYRVKWKHQMVGSCNGLMCLAPIGRPKKVLLWNPSTRWISPKSPILDCNSPTECITLFGFGYDRLSEKYKVVAVLCDTNATNLVKVYTFGDSSWRNIQDFPYHPKLYSESAKLVSGTLNWVATRTVDYDSQLAVVPVDQLVIVSFDLGKETYGEVLLPNVNSKLLFVWPLLTVLMDCLCFFYDRNQTHLVVWVMKEYGIRESWTKLVTIPYLYIKTYSPCCSLIPLFISENGEILLHRKYVKLLHYNPRDEVFEYPLNQSKNDFFAAETYVESLVSPYF